MTRACATTFQITAQQLFVFFHVICSLSTHVLPQARRLLQLKAGYVALRIRDTKCGVNPMTRAWFLIPIHAHALLPQVRRLLLLKAGMVRWEDRDTSLFMRGDAGVGYRKVLMPFMHQVQVGAGVVWWCGLRLCFRGSARRVGYRKVLMPFMHQVQVGAGVVDGGRVLGAVQGAGVAIAARKLYSPGAGGCRTAAVVYGQRDAVLANEL